MKSLKASHCSKIITKNNVAKPYHEIFQLSWTTNTIVIPNTGMQEHFGGSYFYSNGWWTYVIITNKVGSVCLETVESQARFKMINSSKYLYWYSVK